MTPHEYIWGDKMGKFIAYKISGVVIYNANDIQSVNDVLEDIRQDGTADIDDVELVNARNYDDAWKQLGEKGWLRDK